MTGAREEGVSAVPGSGWELESDQVSVSTLKLEAEGPGVQLGLEEALGYGSVPLESLQAAG